MLETPRTITSIIIKPTTGNRQTYSSKAYNQFKSDLQKLLNVPHSEICITYTQPEDNLLLIHDTQEPKTEPSPEPTKPTEPTEPNEYATGFDPVNP